MGRRKYLVIATTKMLKDIFVKEFDTFTDREVSVVSIVLYKY